MKPEPAHALERLMQALLGDLMPNVQPSYRQASVMANAMMVGVMREEIDRAAARRVEENAALRALFADATAVVKDGALCERVAAAARSADASLLVPALDESNRTLRTLLIELHAHVEELPGDAARRVEAAIWRELAASTERRKLGLGPC
jgi:hypothetical protein